MYKAIVGLLLCVLASNTYSSSIWIEQNAQDTVAGAESIQGISALTEIHGSLGITNDLDTADVYRFQIRPEDVGQLTIITLSELVNGWSTNLYIFDGDGNAIIGKKCCTGPGANTKTVLSVSGLSAGEYLLGVSLQQIVPYSDEGPIFGSDGYPFVYSGPLTGFGGSWSGLQMEYQLSIIGASPLNIVPVPAAVWLFSSGFVVLIGLARRKVRA